MVTSCTVEWAGWRGGYVAKNGATVLKQGTYTSNSAGQRTALAYQAPDGSTRNLSWSYDGAGHLSGETRNLPAHSASWSLDAVGNRRLGGPDQAPLEMP